MEKETLFYFLPFPSNSCRAHEENEWDSFLSLKLKGEMKENPEICLHF